MNYTEVIRCNLTFGTGIIQLFSSRLSAHPISLVLLRVAGTVGLHAVLVLCRISRLAHVASIVDKCQGLVFHRLTHGEQQLGQLRNISTCRQRGELRRRCNGRQLQQHQTQIGTTAFLTLNLQDRNECREDFGFGSFHHLLVRLQDTLQYQGQGRQDVGSCCHHTGDDEQAGC